MNKKNSPLVSFKDLMQAKMEREKRESKVPTNPPTYQPTNLPAHQPTNLPIQQEISLQPVSPERDFSKVPNSVRRAIEQGMFPNSSLPVYLYLLSLTRTAIKPKRIVKVPKSELLNGSNLRAEKALLKNLAYLNSTGFIKTTVCNGDRKGNEYEVFTPDEITHLPTHPPTNIPTNVRLSDTQVPTDLKQVGRWVSEPINTGDSDIPKTSFKDIENNDDEPFGKMNETLAKMFEKVSGKRPQKADAAKLNELAELLAMELEIAAARTKSVSNVPAFLTEHLRRRLLGKLPTAKPSTDKSGISKSLRVGKSSGESTESFEEYKAEPLSKEGREAVLKTIREYIEKGQEEFVMSQKDSYTTDDWDWLITKVDKEAKVK